MEKYLDLLKQSGWVGISISVIAGIILLVMIVNTIIKLFTNIRHTGMGTRIIKTQNNQSTQGKDEAVTDDLYFEPIGIYKAIVFRLYRNILIMDWTVIPEPIGSLITADITCPVEGDHFQVKANGKGFEDYEPRDKPLNGEETPLRAYDTVHSDPDVIPFWAHRKPFWKDASNWFAAGCLFLDLIFFLAVTGS